MKNIYQLALRCKKISDEKMGTKGGKAKCGKGWMRSERAESLINKGVWRV